MKITIDELAVMSDDDLYSLGRKTKSRISEFGRDTLRRITNNKKDILYYLQTDMCYIQREIKIRNARNAAHEKWLQK